MNGILIVPFHVLSSSHIPVFLQNSDYNFVRQGDQCVAAGPEPIPEGVCPGNHETEKYTGSSGYRLIPGNTCKKEGGVVLDKPITKDCSLGKSLPTVKLISFSPLALIAQPPEGNATHQTV